MRHFIVEITYLKPLAELADIVPHHRAFLDEGYAKGWLLCSGPQASRLGGMVVARAPSQADLEAFFAGDPYRTGGAATYRFVEFEPVKHQPLLTEWLTG